MRRNAAWGRERKNRAPERRNRPAGTARVPAVTFAASRQKSRFDNFLRNFVPRGAFFRNLLFAPGVLGSGSFGRRVLLLGFRGGLRDFPQHALRAFTRPRIGAFVAEHGVRPKLGILRISRLQQRSREIGARVCRLRIQGRRLRRDRRGGRIVALRLVEIIFP